MNKISAYILLLFIFLGLSRTFSPSKKKTFLIPNEQAIPNFFLGEPLTVILVDSFQAGLIISTYFQKYIVIHGFDDPKHVIVRTNKKVWDNNIKNIGMSIFRRWEHSSKESINPMPPGFLYLGDPSYGYWRYNNSGKREWYFHNAYKNFPKLFGWGKFKPSYLFFKKSTEHQNNNTPFYGPNNEFGLNGYVTKENYKNLLYKNRRSKLKLKAHLNKYITLPFLKKRDL